MPKTTNLGRLTLRHASHFIQLKIGEEMTLVPQGGCVESWHHFTLDAPGIVARMEGTAEGVRLRAIGRGRTTLSAPMPTFLL